MRVNLSNEFTKIVQYFGDSCVFLKQKFPKKKLKLTILGAEHVENWSNYSSNAHSALFDVWAMASVLKSLNVNMTFKDFIPGLVKKSSFSPRRSSKTDFGRYYESLFFNPKSFLDYRKM